MAVASPKELCEAAQKGPRRLSYQVLSDHVTVLDVEGLLARNRSLSQDVIMTVDQLALAIKGLLPIFQVVEGYYVLVMPGNPAMSAGCLRNLGYISRADIKCAERDMNRCFIIANVLDQMGVDVDYDFDPGSLLMVAEVLESLIRDGLAREFPDQEFEVETIGIAGVEHEPLELCVTFHQR